MKNIYIVGIEHTGEPINWNTVKVFDNLKLAELYAEGISAAYSCPFIKTFQIQTVDQNEPDCQ